MVVKGSMYTSAILLVVVKGSMYKSAIFTRDCEGFHV